MQNNRFYKVLIIRLLYNYYAYEKIFTHINALVGGFTMVRERLFGSTSFTFAEY